MNKKFHNLIRFSLTFVVLSAAVVLGISLWNDYMNSPWTRDGRIRADITLVAPDVDGIVADIFVKDNQFVKKGELLFKIDDRRYLDKYNQAKALADAKKAAYDMKRYQFSKRAPIEDESVSKEEKDDASFAVSVAKAEYEEAMANMETAKLNWERTEVRAPQDGWISNLLLKSGDYARVGSNCMALVNKDSFWVNGYFEEHKISLLHMGDKVDVTPLGTNFVIKGHIESIAKAIIDRDNTTGERLLANVNPVFTWVRLAQRIPVRIHIDEVPKGFQMSAGMTCSVKIQSPSK